MDRADASVELRVRPLTADNWPDLERLFGPRGACAGCWCMAPRLTRREWAAGKGEPNKRALERLVRGGRVPGLLAYAGRQPIGWCAIEPRNAYPTLDRSRVLKRIDNEPVWSVACFFVARPFRRRGVSKALLEAAVRHARRHGALIVEGYPVDPGRTWPDTFAWTGLARTFRSVGFVEVARRSPTRPVMRLASAPQPAAASDARRLKSSPASRKSSQSSSRRAPSDS